MRCFDLWHIFKHNKTTGLEASPRGVILTTILSYIASLQGDKIDSMQLANNVCLQLHLYLKSTNCVIANDTERDNFKYGMGLKAVRLDELSGQKTSDSKSDTH